MKAKLTLLTCLVLVITSSCKKYEEGPAFSLRGKKQRVINTWGVAEVFYVKDGERTDSSEFFANTEYTFELNDGYTRIDYTKSGNDSFYIFEEGEWLFENNKEEIVTTGIEFTYQLPQQIKVRERTTTNLWQIRKLKETQLWMWLIISDTERYEYKFEPR